MSLQEEKFYQSCPNCKARYAYLTKNVDSERRVSCQNCGQLMNAGEESTQNLPPKKKDEELTFRHGIVLMIIFISISLLLFLMTIRLSNYWPGIWITL